MATQYGSCASRGATGTLRSTDRFAAERAQPFHDLLALIEPAAIDRAVDLGCGPASSTALAADAARHRRR